MTVFLTVFYDHFLNMHYLMVYSLHIHDICKYFEQTAWSVKYIFEAFNFLPILKAEVIDHMVQYVSHFI